MTSGPALGNLIVLLIEVVRAAFGPALANLTVMLRKAVRATEDWVGAKATYRAGDYIKGQENSR
jgi:hypothetical protein